MNKFIYKPNLSLREIRAGISDEQFIKRYEDKKTRHELDQMCEQIRFKNGGFILQGRLSSDT